MRVIITVVFVSIGVILSYGMVHGVRLAHTAKLHNLYGQAEQKHRRAMRWALWLTLLGAVLIEFGLVQAFGRQAAGSEVRAHLYFAIPFLLSLIAMNTVTNGHRHPVIHGWLSLITIFILYPFTFFTGMRLLW